MLLLLFKILTIFFGGHYYKNRYPKEYEDYSNQLFEYINNNDRLKPYLPYLFKFGYGIIYIYSFCQIILNKGIKISLPYVKIIRDKTCKYLVNRSPNQETILKKELTTNNTSIISFFNEGVLISKEPFSEGLSYESLCYDLLIITDLIMDDMNTPEVKNIVTCMNKMIPTDFKYELSDIKFGLCRNSKK